MLHIHEGRGLDATLLLEKARKKQRDLDEIARLAYKAYLEGKGKKRQTSTQPGYSGT